METSGDGNVNSVISELLQRVLVIYEDLSNNNNGKEKKHTDLNNNNNGDDDEIVILDENNNYNVALKTAQQAPSVDAVEELSKRIRVLSPKEIYLMTNNRGIVYTNELFEICFDTPTPRPHLIVKFKSCLTQMSNPERRKSIKEFNNEELLSLFHVILEFIVNYLNDITLPENSATMLSFHTGRWASCKEFHCHLCMDIEVYVKLFNKFKIIGPIFPTTKWLLKDNKLSSKEVYLMNVRNYRNVMSQETNEYKSSDIKLIENMLEKSSNVISHDIADEKLYIDAFQKRFSHIRLSFETDEPKLKFKSNKPMDYVNLLKVLCKYAIENGYFNKPNGCHICIELNDPINNTQARSSTDGYLRLSAERYYRIHPMPSIFLNNFKNNTDFYIDT